MKRMMEKKMGKKGLMRMMAREAPVRKMRAASLRERMSYKKLILERAKRDPRMRRCPCLMVRKTKKRNMAWKREMKSTDLKMMRKRMFSKNPKKESIRKNNSRRKTRSRVVSLTMMNLLRSLRRTCTMKTRPRNISAIKVSKDIWPEQRDLEPVREPEEVALIRDPSTSEPTNLQLIKLTFIKSP